MQKCDVTRVGQIFSTKTLINSTNEDTLLKMAYLIELLIFDENKSDIIQSLQRFLFIAGL